MLIDIASCINIIKDKKLRSKNIRVDKIFLLRSFFDVYNRIFCRYKLQNV